MDDENIWRSIGGKNFCSFKMKTRTDTFCKNPNNVTGMCNEFSCPLANSNYATVREDSGVLYLYIKFPERIHKPSQSYEKIKLSEEYEEAVSEIERNLEHLDNEIIHKCKQRLTKLTLYLRRKKAMKGSIEMRAIKKKQVKREKLGAMKALCQVNFERQIEKELYKRLESGVYGINMKDKFEKRSRVYDFEESDEDPFSSRKKSKGKAASRIPW